SSATGAGSRTRQWSDLGSRSRTRSSRAARGGSIEPGKQAPISPSAHEPRRRVRRMSRAPIMTSLRALVSCLALAAACSECHSTGNDTNTPNAARKGGEPMTNKVVLITVSGPGAPVLRKGPIPATVLIQNASAGPVEVLLPYPNPNHLRFDCASGTRKHVERQEIERTI